MARSRRRRSRTTGQRKYKRIFDLVCEGVKTEPEYFNWVSRNLDNDAVKLNIISKKPGESSPSALIAAASLSARECSEKYHLFMSSNKGIDTSKLSVESLLRATERAKQKHYSSYDSSRNHLDFRKVGRL